MIMLWAWIAGLVAGAAGGLALGFLAREQFVEWALLSARLLSREAKPPKS